MIGTFCLLVGAFAVIDAEQLLVDARYKCDHVFSLDSGDSVDIIYNGAALDTESCNIKFEIDTSENEICIKPLELNLDCGTNVEYQKHFVANSINDGLLTCSMNNQYSYDETCEDYVSTFFLVIKKDEPYSSTNENFKINVYAKDRPGFDYSIDTTSYWWISLLSIIPTFFIVASVLICRQRLRRQQGATVLANYNTGTGFSTVQTGVNAQNPYGITANQQAGIQPPINSGNQYSGQQSADGVIVHPPAFAYPTQNQPAFGFNYNQQAPQAPSDNPAAPPPSYESLVTK